MYSIRGSSNATFRDTDSDPANGTKPPLSSSIVLTYRSGIATRCYYSYTARAHEKRVKITSAFSLLRVRAT